MDDLRALAADLRAAGMALCIDVVLNHTAREHAVGAGRDRGRRADARLLPDVPGPHRARRLRAHAARGVPGHRAGQLHVGAGARPLGVDDVQRVPVGPRLHEPRGVRRDGRGDARPRGRRRRRAAPRRRAVPVEARSGTNCQNQPEVHELLQAFRAAMRIAAPARRVQGRGDRRRRATSSPYLGAGRHEGKECDLAYHNVLMVLLWSALASGRVALLTHTLQAMPPVPRGAGWVTYVRCHDDIGWAITEEDAGGGRRGRLPAPPVPGRLLRRRVPGLVRARRALPARPADRRGADERDRGLAGRPRAARSSGDASRSTSRCAACCCSTRSRSPTAGCR